ncbi:MAG: 1,4-alpha-glucan branching protein GlgB [Hydrogenobaculum sp.]
MAYYKYNHDISLLTDEDLYLFNEGTHYHLYEKLGAHVLKDGVYFAVWAPNAKEVYVEGSFNFWNKKEYPLRPKGSSGIWEIFIEGLQTYELYKYYIVSNLGYELEKRDPFAFYTEIPPKSAGIIYDISGYQWKDESWLLKRRQLNHYKEPISIYEVHLGSWRRTLENNFLSYKDIAHQLVEYVKNMGFTHVEFLPIMEHPFYGSWGYQTLSYFAPTSRYGEPKDFMYLVDLLHQNDIGVILDWVPSHFATDDYGLSFFDGTHLYEHMDRRKGYHPDWGSYIFNYGRHEVRAFLISSANFWFDKYHVDGIRVDAVASMLYLDYSRKEGEWEPNIYGGKENLEAIDFLRKLNEAVYIFNPGIFTVAEESTAWPMVTKPTYIGGLGFGFKWDMGWMHDTLRYFSKDPIHRKYHQQDITFRMLYAFNENFILPLSHDEVVHGKGSLIGKMPGDYWQKFANLRLLLSYMYASSGKKLLFMGNEFGQFDEWNHDKSLDWHLLEFDSHKGVQNLVKDLNKIYKNEIALHELDHDQEGFEWVDFQDVEQSIFSFLRKAKNGDFVLCIFNATPVPRHHYKVGVPKPGFYKEILNSDSIYYWGSNVGNDGFIEAKNEPWHKFNFSISLTLPPLGALFLKLA